MERLKKTMTIKEFQSAMKKELERYKNTQDTPKPYFTSMKELSVWLESCKPKEHS